MMAQPKPRFAASSASGAARSSTPRRGSAGLPVLTSGEIRLMRRQQLTEAQIAALFDPPTDRRELVRHCTLSESDTAMIRRWRGDHSRLGYALMLCYLRYPGRPLRINERPPAALISFVADQIDVRPESIDDYLISGQNRRRHAAELQDRLRLRPFGRGPASELASSLLPHAIESDRLAVLAGCPAMPAAWDCCPITPIPPTPLRRPASSG